jgi:hypothetical protein
MTPAEAFCAVAWRGLVPLEQVKAELVARWPWWDERCELVLSAAIVLVELGKPRTRRELAICAVADGYSFRAAADLAVEVSKPIDVTTLEHARAWLLEQMAEVAA